MCNFLYNFLFFFFYSQNSMVPISIQATRRFWKRLYEEDQKPKLKTLLRRFQFSSIFCRKTHLKSCFGDDHCYEKDRKPKLKTKSRRFQFSQISFLSKNKFEKFFVLMTRGTNTMAKIETLSIARVVVLYFVI